MRRSRRNWATGAPGELPAVDLDLTKPSIARVYDYLLGGREHFDVDRRAAIAILNAVPETTQLAKENRQFLQRGVRYLVAEAGIRQLIDIGSGLPSAGNVHEVAHMIDPMVRVVYVDNDPMVLAHARALLATDERSVSITADIREPDTIFDHPDTRELIDFDQPYAVLLGGVAAPSARSRGPLRGRSPDQSAHGGRVLPAGQQLPRR